MSSLAKKVSDCWKLIEVKSNRGSPLPMLICLEIPQFEALYISRAAVSTGSLMFIRYWLVPTISKVAGSFLQDHLCLQGIG